MPVSARFQADFTQFAQAVQKAELSLKGFETGAGKVEKSLNRMADSFSGRKIIQDATLAAEAVNRIGGASKLTESEQARLNAQITEALAKYKALGLEAPKTMTDLAKATERVPEQMTLAQRATGLLKSNITQLAGAFALGNVLGNAVHGLVSWGKAAVESAGATIDLANKTGLSTDAVQRMAYAAKLTGADVKVFADAAVQLGIRLGDGNTGVRAAVNALGLGFEDLRRQRPDEQFTLITRALEQMEDPQTRNKLALELFSDRAKEILPAIAEGYSSLAEGATISSREQLEALDAAADAWDSFVDRQQKNLQAWLGGQVVGFERMKQLTLDQRVQLEALQRQGLSTTEALNKMFRPDVNLPLSGSMREATEAARSYAEQLAEARAKVASLTAEQLKEVEAARKLGKDVEELTARYGVNAVHLGIIDDNNRKAAASARELASEKKKLVDVASLAPPVLNGLRGSVKDLGIQYETSAKSILSMYDALNMSPGVKLGLSALPGVQIGKPGDDPFVKAEGLFGKNFGRDIGQAILGAVQGGGNVIGAAGGAIGMHLTTGLSNHLAKGLSGALEAAVGAVLPGLGALLGPLTTKLFGLFDRNKGRDLVKDFAAGFGGFDALHRQLNELGDEGERLWIRLTQGVGRNNQEQARAAIDAVNAALLRQRDAQLEVKQATEQAAAEMTRAQEAAINDVKSRLSALDTEYNRLFESIKDEAPEEVMGVVEQATRARMDAIQKEREKAQAELDKLTDAMAESLKGMESAVNRVTSAVDRMADAFGGVKVPSAGIPPQNSFANGTNGYQWFGSGTPAMLHGWEKVTPLGKDTADARPVKILTHVVTVDGRQLAEALSREVLA